MESIGFMIFVLFITQSLQTCTVYACEMFLVFIALCIYEFVCLLKQLVTLLPTVTLTYMLGISGRKYHTVALRISTMNFEVVVVQSLSCVQLFTTPWTVARQVSLSFTVSWSLLKLMFIESVMPSNIPSFVALFSSALNLSQHQGPFWWVTFHIRWQKCWSFSISPSNEYSGLISFRIDWFDLLEIQGTLLRLLQHWSSKGSILQHSAFFMIQLSHPYVTTGKTMALTRRTLSAK